MKIALLIHRLTYSGAPKILGWIANQMANRGHDVTVISFFSDERASFLDEKVKFDSLKIRQSRNRFVRNTFGMLKSVSALHKHIKECNPDLIVSFLDSVGYIYLAVNKFFSKRKIVISERVDPYIYHGIISKVRFFLMGYANGIVFQTEGAKDYFKNKKLIYNNSTIIPNPVFLKSANIDSVDSLKVNYSDRDNRIVSVGRLSLKQKRHDVMIEAFEKLHITHPEMKLVIYGDGDGKEKIESLISEKGLDDFVVLAGQVDNVEQHIYNARAFVITSDYEGIPNSLIEAMAIGVPSVSTDCSPGGARLLIEDGENGFVVNRSDSEAIAQRLIELIDNEELSNRFSVASRDIVNKFSEEKIGTLWERYFFQILEGGF